MRIKISILCALFICTLQPLAGFAQTSLQSIEAMATQQAIKRESVITPRMYLERIASDYLPQVLWNQYAMRPQAFSPTAARKPFFDATIPPNARRIDPNAAPTPFPKKKKKATVKAKAKAKPKLPIMLPAIPPVPSVAKPVAPIAPAPPKVATPTTPPLPVPGPRNPLDGGSSATSVTAKDPAWEWPEEKQ